MCAHVARTWHEAAGGEQQVECLLPLVQELLRAEHAFQVQLRYQQPRSFQRLEAHHAGLQDQKQGKKVDKYPFSS